jgi:diguanylate cyclase
MKRVLIIDDTQAIHDDFKKILTAGGPSSDSLAGAKAALFGAEAPRKATRTRFDVDYAHQGEEGFAKVQAAVTAEKPYSVAFVDMRMPPGWDGLQTIRKLWEADPELQVVICSAYSDHSWEDILETLGLTDRLLILKKPFDPMEVLQLATALSEKWSLKRQASLKFEELERLVQQRTTALSHAALHDKLTGLPNRVMFKERLAQAIERSRRPDGPKYAVLFLDFDRFKIVNDSLGHDAGDQLLVEIAARMTECLGSERCKACCTEALAARLGGDEFVVLAEGTTDSLQAPDIARCLLDRLATPYALKGYNLSTTASIGITSSELAYETPDDALRDADTAMYSAKAAGKARFVLFDRHMHEAAKDRLALENELRGAPERGELILHYQPVVYTASGALRGFEALVRWENPARGMVPPNAFIPCAEETGLVVPVGDWVLQKACAQLGEWRKKFPDRADLFMSVNVSAKQLASPRLIDQVKEAVAAAGIDPGLLALEITESAVIADPEFTIGLLNRIKEIGVRLYMDDFGTGYTSLGYLHRLPLDGIKIDRSFLKCVSERRDYAAVVDAIINLARNLGITVIAEGVETVEQLAMLQSMECEFAQGYYFGRPAVAKTAEEFIVGRPVKMAA